MVALNQRAYELVGKIEENLEKLQVSCLEVAGGGKLLDFGVQAAGGHQSGIELAEVCLSGLGTVQIEEGTLGDVEWPYVSVKTNHPLEACLFSQYAGWQIQTDDYFAMGSGPMRAAYAGEPLFEKYPCDEKANSVVGILESSRLPDGKVFEFLANKMGIEPKDIVLLVASVTSLAGNVQVVARSLETAMHKLYELGFDLHRIHSGTGIAPLAAPATDDLAGIGKTNDAILYGGKVTFEMTGDDESIAKIGPKIPSVSSSSYGKPFVEVFHEFDDDFYKIDPMLFSPAEVTIHNEKTGSVHSFGSVNEDVLKKSFGLN